MRISLFAAAILAALLFIGQPYTARAGLYVSITVAPPALPVYVQPPIPAAGYIWSPGYWAWDDDDGDYYWVPGAWVPAPAVGLLWTPGYWGWRDGVYAWNGGYWGPHIGFYGGVNYGFGYTGVGFAGGVWVAGVFSYNKYCTNVGGPGVVTNVYNKTVIVNTTANVSFNGGTGGIQRQPNKEELAAANEHHIPPSTEQTNHQQMARKNPDLKFAKNQGKPAIAATSKAGDFSKGHVFAAKSAGSAAKPAAFHTNQSGPNKGNTQTKQNNFIRPKGTALNTQTKRSGPVPGPKPVNKTKTPPKDPHHN